MIRHYPTDEVLLSRCAKGNQLAWRQLIEKYERLVYSITKQQGLTQDDGEDVFMRTFESLYNGIQRGQDIRSLPSWLVAVTIRETVRFKKMQRLVVNLESEALSDLPAGDESDVEALSAAGIRAEAVRSAMEKLSDKCRHLLEALYVNGDRYEDVAKALKMPIGTIGPNRARCLVKLKTMISPGILD